MIVLPASRVSFQATPVSRRYVTLCRFASKFPALMVHFQAKDIRSEETAYNPLSKQPSESEVLALLSSAPGELHHSPEAVSDPVTDPTRPLLPSTGQPAASTTNVGDAALKPQGVTYAVSLPDARGVDDRPAQPTREVIPAVHPRSCISLTPAV